MPKKIAESKPLYKYFKNLTINKDGKEMKLLDEIKERYKEAVYVLEKYEYTKYEKLKNNKSDIKKIENYLEVLKSLQSFLKPLEVKDPQLKKDGGFYSEFNPLYESVSKIIPLYNQSRNYLTKKPYSIEKYKLNFGNLTLGAGWDKNKEKNNSCVLFVRNGKYYLGVMDPKHKKIFEKPDYPNSSVSYKKMNYKLLPGPKKMLPNVFFNKDKYKPSQEITEIRNHASHTEGGKPRNGYEKKEFNREDMRKMVNFYKDSIEMYKDWKGFNFKFSSTDKYEKINEFYREVENQGYKITFQDIPESYVNKCVDEGSLYLFEIYSKDFSDKTRGKPNLQTLYWKALFEEENLKDVVYKLNGGAELFYRERSIEYSKEKWKKGHHEGKKEKKQKYPIIKDRRYAKDTFLFHVSITCNFKTEKQQKFNDKVNEYLHENSNVNIIGIDRGERNLVYYTIINQEGKVIKQCSLNKINNKDYHKLLSKKAEERRDAQKSWGTIQKIKDLKEGYLSQVVHELTKLMLEHNAIIVFEDLNFGFKRSRTKIEKQIYQKLEKMLIDKLNYLVFKDKKPNEIGGLMEALQLTEFFESFQKMGKQTGFIFYVPAYHTSKVCPATGFVNLLYPKYETIKTAQEFFGKFDNICFNKKEDYFEFHFNYEKFTDKAEGSKQDWVACSHRERLEKETGRWESRKVNISDELKSLFEKRGIDITDGTNLVGEIKKQNSSEFFKKLIRMIKLTLQIRNSEIGGDEDFIISPVKDSSGVFFDSRNVKDHSMPKDADANGAYHTALKGLLRFKQLNEKSREEIAKFKPDLSNKAWYEFIQNR